MTNTTYKARTVQFPPDSRERITMQDLDVDGIETPEKQTEANVHDKDIVTNR